jgi:hypothetical protein
LDADNTVRGRDMLSKRSSEISVGGIAISHRQERAVCVLVFACLSMRWINSECRVQLLQPCRKLRKGSRLATLVNKAQPITDCQASRPWQEKCNQRCRGNLKTATTSNYQVLLMHLLCISQGTSIPSRSCCGACDKLQRWSQLCSGSRTLVRSTPDLYLAEQTPGETRVHSR